MIGTKRLDGRRIALLAADGFEALGAAAMRRRRAQVRQPQVGA